MKKNEKKRTYNRVHKEQRDFDALFNAQIDESARERRQKRHEKRKKRRTNSLVLAIVKFSKVKVSKSAKARSAKPEQAAFTSDSSRRVIREPQILLRKIEQPEALPVRVREPEALLRKIAESEAISRKADMPKAIPVEDVNREVVAVEPVIVPEPAVAGSVAPKAVSFWTRAVKATKDFYNEFTDKEIIAKLHEAPQDQSDVFAEIKESLLSASTDVIEDKTVKDAPVSDEVMFEAAGTLENIAQSAIEDDAPAVIEADDIATEEALREDSLQVVPVIDDNTGAAVEFLFDGKNSDERGQAELTDDVLPPEMIEAMREIDREYVLSVLEPKFASAIDKIDAVLEKYPHDLRCWIHAKLVGINFLPERFKINRSQNSAFAVAKRAVSRPLIVLGRWASAAVRSAGAGLSRLSGFVRGKASICYDTLELKLRYSGFGKAMSRLGDNARFWFGRERNIKVVSFSTVLIVAVFFATATYLEGISTYAVSFMNSPIGIVKDKEDILNVISDVEEKLKKEYNAQVFIDPDKDFEFTLVRELDVDVMSEDEIFAKFDDINKINIAAFGLQIDGIIAVVLPEKEQVENLLDGIKSDYLAGKDTSEFDSVSFGENIQILPVQTKMMQISDEEEAKRYLLKGTSEEKIHTVQSGETLSGIAKNYGIKTGEIEAANPGIDPKKLQIGQQISLIAPKPFITVETVETRTYIAEVPFDITYEESGNLFKGETTVKATGKAGEREVTANIVKRNGVEVSRVELSSTTLKEPVNQVVIKGTKALPALLGTGTFQNPVRGTLSSRYGQRWSRMHQGIDIAAPKGTAIKAADGGTVIYAGYDGAYGNTVRINHGANKVTVYAHCSTIAVKQGQKVAKGQQIATVGTTGRTTGPHLHFEVRINGNIKNPLDYVSY